MIDEFISLELTSNDIFKVLELCIIEGNGNLKILYQDGLFMGLSVNLCGKIKSGITDI